MDIQSFYSHFNLPKPTFSYEERCKKRLAWRNERSLYKTKCALTGENILSIYNSSSPFPVYSPNLWYSDKWDPLKYGQNFDFNRSFFEQFYELQCKVPRISNILSNCENCDYCNVVGDSKNCYMLYGSIECEDCLYGNPFRCKNCIDSFLLRESQFCYECLDSTKLYECFFCQNCQNSSGLYFCFDMIGCQNCFLCGGLKQQKFCILNKNYSEEEYIKEKNRLLSLPKNQLEEKYEALKKQVARKYMNGINNENVVGDYVSNSKNCYYSFNCEKCEDVNFCSQILDSNNCLDCDFGEIGNFIYETSGFYKCSNIFFCHWVWDSSNLMYCSSCCADTKDCFGCISLRHKQYCILNKQYSKEEYESLVPKIIQHMKTCCEFGRFFPKKFSPFPYKDTIAEDYYPDDSLTEDPNFKNVPKTTDPLVIKCEVSGKYFKLQEQELKFYKRYNLWLPKIHPNERHKRRIVKRNPRKIITGNCANFANCGEIFQTTYQKNDPSIVLCEKCYLNR